LPLQWVFCGQTASSLRPYECSGKIMCTGHLKTLKQKLKFGGDTHVTMNPKQLNPKPLKMGG